MVPKSIHKQVAVPKKEDERILLLLEEICWYKFVSEDDKLDIT